MYEPFTHGQIRETVIAQGEWAVYKLDNGFGVVGPTFCETQPTLHAAMSRIPKDMRIAFAIRTGGAL